MCDIDIDIIYTIYILYINIAHTYIISSIYINIHTEKMSVMYICMWCIDDVCKKYIYLFNDTYVNAIITINYMLYLNIY